jgi:hypothetical protein
MTPNDGSPDGGRLEEEKSIQERALARAVQEIKSLLLPLRQGEFSSKIDKVMVYVQSAANASDAKTAANFVRFAHINLDAALVQALESLVFRPRLASKTDEQKKATALQKTFDRLERPAEAMLEHYRTSSDPLNKYLVAGPWGHRYLENRHLDLAEFDRELVEMLGAGESPAGRIVLGHARLRKAIDEAKEQAKGGM